MCKFIVAVLARLGIKRRVSSVSLRLDERVRLSGEW